MKQLGWCQDHEQPIFKIPLLFTFPPVETLMKELTKLNSTQPYRISYLGPRWADSLTFHKKYSPGQYLFNQRQLAKNTSYFSESMMNNQFYKNEIFYRAFQGMNPTLDLKQQLIFQSRFEGGNLDCVVRVNQTEYDLFLRIDSNTRGNIYWFYFAIKNCTKGKKVKINICNLTKSNTHHAKQTICYRSQGLNPFVYSSDRQQWTADRVNKLTFCEKKLRYKFLYDRLVLRKYYELSFEIELNGEEEVRFAYCIPYTYSDLVVDLKSISSVAQVSTLGQSLTGVKIPLVMIGQNIEQNPKPVLLITGRVHPGQTNSSIVLSSLMKYLCFSQEARYLRQKVITIIIPMLNPDGVILGNSRCGASGKDLNRQFKARSKVMFPEVVHLKNLVQKITETHEIELYLDFHGHSRKKNVFMFGPDYNITQPDYYRSRVFPKMLSGITNIFRYYSCTYDIPNDKKTTARAVMLYDLQVPIFFTVETSLGFYHDYSSHKDQVFTKKKWEELGENMVIALKEYYEGIQQYELFLEAKRKTKRQIAEDIKQAAINTAPQPIFPQKKFSAKEQNLPKKQNKEIKQPKDIKIFKVFEEIKQLEDKNRKLPKKQKAQASDEQSDSNNSEQEFQKQKMKQFSSMVTDFVQEESRRRTVINIQQKLFPLKKNNQSLHRRNKFQLRKKREQRAKQEQLILYENFSEDSKMKFRRNQIKTESKQRSFQKVCFSEPKKELQSEPIKHSYPIIDEQDHAKEKERLFSTHNYIDEDVDLISVYKKSTKLNVRMFNFSKGQGNSRSGRYAPEAYQDLRIGQQQFGDEGSDGLHSLQFQYPVHKNPLSAFQKPSEQYSDVRREQQKKKYQSEDLKMPKTKIGFPPSFYRIKYHNSQRKRQESKRNQSNQQEIQRVAVVNGHKKTLTSNYVPRGRQEEKVFVVEGDEEKKTRLYAQLRKYSRR